MNSFSVQDFMDTLYDLFCSIISNGKGCRKVTCQGQFSCWPVFWDLVLCSCLLSWELRRWECGRGPAESSTTLDQWQRLAGRRVAVTRSLPLSLSLSRSPRSMMGATAPGGNLVHYVGHKIQMCKRTGYRACGAESTGNCLPSTGAPLPLHVGWSEARPYVHS